VKLTPITIFFDKHAQCDADNDDQLTHVVAFLNRLSNKLKQIGHAILNLVYVVLLWINDDVHDALRLKKDPARIVQGQLSGGKHHAREERKNVMPVQTR